MMRYNFSWVFGFWLAMTMTGYSQQVPDTTFSTGIEHPEYTIGTGPVLCLDSAHNNFHTAGGGYAPFARVARKDGYQVKDFNLSPDDIKDLESCDIYMVVNPVHESDLNEWVLPNPSAFSENEIQVINEWVEKGGSFFMIADHMPFGGAAGDLGRSFGFEYSNGFAMLDKPQNSSDWFTKDNGRLQTTVLSGAEMDSIISYTGSAFRYPEEAQAILTFKSKDYSLEPDTAWRFTENTPSISLEDYAQGAFMPYKKGKVVMWGEAAMFTAQLFTNNQGTFKFGLNAPEARQNLNLLLNILHWLD